MVKLILNLRTCLFSKRLISMKKTRHPLRDYRQEKNLSMQELASELKISAPVLHRLEYNHGSRTVRHILKYCRDNNLKPELFYPYD